MDYGSLLKKSFDISWLYKRLWVLGFFAASLGSIGNISDFGDKDFGWLEKIHPGLADIIEEWILSPPGVAIIVALVLTLLIIGLIFIIMHFISVAGLIKAAFDVDTGKEIKLQKLIKFGANYFWRFIGLGLIFFGLFIAFFAVLILPLILAIIALKAFGLILLIFIVPIAFAGIFIFSTIYSLAQREIVAYQTPVIDSISEAYKLVTKHLGPNLIIFMLSLGLGLAIFITTILIIALFAIPLMIVGYQSVSILILTLIIVLPIFIAVSIVVEGFLGTFFNTMMSLFYIELRKLSPRYINQNPAAPISPAA